MEANRDRAFGMARRQNGPVQPTFALRRGLGAIGLQGLMNLAGMRTRTKKCSYATPNAPPSGRMPTGVAGEAAKPSWAAGLERQAAALAPITELFLRV
jgi:hypothetical protein